MALKKEEILEAISEMSVMDIVDLISAMEEKFGVSAAAPVAAYNKKFINELPLTFEEVIKLAEKSLVLWPIKPIDAINKDPEENRLSLLSAKS